MYINTRRRNFLRLMGVSGAGLLAAACAAPQTTSSPAPGAAPAEAPVATPDEALGRLMAGNQRFVEARQQRPNETRARLIEVAQGQSPFASILGCADSRVPPELIFDRGFGDLFVVRAAGNIADEVAIGSLEFSTAALGSKVIMVLGHERCGAVAAAVAGEPVPGFIADVVADLKPAAERVAGQSGDAAVENAIVANVQIMVERLVSQSSILAEQVRTGQIRVLGGVYDLDTGAVRLV